MSSARHQEILNTIGKAGAPISALSFGPRVDVHPTSNACFPVLTLLSCYGAAIGKHIEISSLLRNKGERSHDAFTEADFWVGRAYDNSQSQVAFQLRALPDLYKLGKCLPGWKFRLGFYLRVRGKGDTNGAEIVKLCQGNRNIMEKELVITTSGGIHISYCTNGFTPLAHGHADAKVKWDCRLDKNHGSAPEPLFNVLCKAGGYLNNAAIESLAKQITNILSKLGGKDTGISHPDLAKSGGTPGSNSQGSDGQTVDPVTGQPTASGDPAEQMTDLSYWAIVTNTIIEDWKLDG